MFDEKTLMNQKTLTMMFAAEDLLNNKDHNDIRLFGKYYMRRTPYRLELRHDDSDVWLAYVMYKDRDISLEKIANLLREKYLILIGKHFV